VSSRSSLQRLRLAAQHPSRIRPYLCRRWAHLKGRRTAVTVDRSSLRPVVVYCVITGSYDPPPTVIQADPDISYLCFADELEAVPGPWELVRIDGYFEDTKLTSGYLKSCPHLLFSRDTVAVWVDGNLTELRLGRAEVFELVADRPVAAPAHRERSRVTDEARVVADLGLDHPARTASLLQHLADLGYPDDQGLAATMLLIRDLSDPDVHRANASWWSGIATLSRRDQLTFNIALWSVGIRWTEIDVDYREPNRIFNRRPHAEPRGRMLEPSGRAAVASAWLVPRGSRPAAGQVPPIWPEERWSAVTSELLRSLNSVVGSSDAPLLDTYCHAAGSTVGPHTPPDVRRSWKREFLRRAAACSVDALEIGFDAGYRAAVLLGSNPRLHLRSVDGGGQGYAEPCAREVAAAHPGRHTVTWGEPREVLHQLPTELMAALDLVHMDAAGGVGEFETHLEWFLAHARRGCLLVVDGVLQEGMDGPLRYACRSGALEEVLPGLPPSAEIRLFST
jgi:hypothetical protein